mgnify:CR=1 FL=1
MQRPARCSGHRGFRSRSRSSAALAPSAASKAAARPAVERRRARWRERRLELRRLREATPRLRELIARLARQRPSAPVVATATAEPNDDPSKIVELLIAQVTDFKPRYMHPILLTAPLLFFLWLDHRPTDQSRERWFAGLVAAFVLIVFGGLAGQAILEPAQCRNCWLQMPLPALARDIEAQGLAGGTIVTADARIGGNLGLYLRNSRILTPDFPMADASATGRGQCLLVWNSRLMGPTAPPP